MRRIRPAQNFARRSGAVAAIDGRVEQRRGEDLDKAIAIHAASPAAIASPMPRWRRSGSCRRSSPARRPAAGSPSVNVRWPIASKSGSGRWRAHPRPAATVVSAPRPPAAEDQRRNEGCAATPRRPPARGATRSCSETCRAFRRSPVRRRRQSDLLRRTVVSQHRHHHSPRASATTGGARAATSGSVFSSNGCRPSPVTGRNQIGRDAGSHLP